MTIPGVGPFHGWRQIIATIEAMRQRLGILSTATFTLNASPATTTTVTDGTITASSQILFQAADAAGAGAISSAFISDISDGSFTLTHAAAAGTRTLRYFVFG